MVYVDHRLSPLGIMHQTCQRRQILPSPVASAEISALSVIRKNVGKDLSTISMPISMNEPLSLLQRACEELEYSELLDKASTMSNSMDRLLHVAVFAVSGYASSQHRVGRKVCERLCHFLQQQADTNTVHTCSLSIQ